MVSLNFGKVGYLCFNKWEGNYMLWDVKKVDVGIWGVEYVLV